MVEKIKSDDSAMVWRMDKKKRREERRSEEVMINSIVKVEGARRIPRQLGGWEYLVMRVGSTESDWVAQCDLGVVNKVAKGKLREAKQNPQAGSLGEWLKMHAKDNLKGIVERRATKETEGAKEAAALWQELNA